MPVFEPYTALFSSEAEFEASLLYSLSLSLLLSPLSPLSPQKQMYKPIHIYKPKTHGIHGAGNISRDREPSCTCHASAAWFPSVEEQMRAIFLTSVGRSGGTVVDDCVAHRYLFQQRDGKKNKGEKNRKILPTT